MNLVIENYIDKLKEKFLTCEVTQTPLRNGFFGVREATLVNVDWGKGKEWFEVPLVFSNNITPEQFKNGKEDLDKYEDEITKQLRRYNG